MTLTYDGGDQLIWAASPWVLVIAAGALRLAQQGLIGRAAAAIGPGRCNGRVAIRA